MEKKATITQVASLAGVSKSTVSNFLNNRFDTMSPLTREKIERAVQELDYTPSLSARRLSAKEKCKAICMIIPHNIARAFDTTYFPTVISACGQIAEKLDYNVILFAMNRKNIEKNMEYLKGMASTVVDGFLIFDLLNEDRYFKEFEKADIPYVCIGKIEDYDDYHYVASDHYRAECEILNHLLQLGHRRIAQMTEDFSGVVERTRHNAYFQMMRRYGIQPDESYLCSTDPYAANAQQQAYEKFQKLLLQPQPPTALICPSLFLPVLERILEEQSLSVPEDLSVGILEYNPKFQPAFTHFTRVDSIAEQVTELAFKKLLRLIYAPDSVFEPQMCPLNLVVGDTSAPPRP